MCMYYTHTLTAQECRSAPLGTEAETKRRERLPEWEKKAGGKGKKIKEQDVEEINTKIKVGLWKEQAICLLRSLKT